MKSESYRKRSFFDGIAQSIGQGIALELMNRLVDVARANQKTLLLLDTETGSAAEFLYRILGWHELGEVSGHTIEKDGSLSSTTFFWFNI